MKKQRTKSENFGATARGFLGNYRFGVDFWALGLFGLLLLPNIVWWCYSPANDVLRTAQTDALEIASRIFEVLTVAILIFVLRKDRAPVDLFSPFAIFGILSALLYYAAWIFYFAAYVNGAVLLFLSVLPCTALLCLAVLRKNYFALMPLALFFALHLAWTWMNFL